MHIEVAGSWQRPAGGGSGSGGVAAASSGGGATTASRPAATFKAAAIVRASGKLVGSRQLSRAAAPTDLAEGGGSGGRGGGVVASAAVTASRGILVSTNSLVAAIIPTIFIPIAAMSSAGEACPGTQLPLLSAEDVEAMVFGSPQARGRPAVAGATLASIFNQCSYGKSRMTRQNSVVADVVELPCTGSTSNGDSWAFDQCKYAGAVAAAAEDVLQGRGGQNEKYKYRVYLLPPGMPCGVGWANLGCTDESKCQSWMPGDMWGDPHAIAHEIGHNLFLSHSGAFDGDGNYDEYGDNSCTMGWCPFNCCFNIPHAWQMGWIAVQHLNGSSLQAGQTVLASLLGQATSDRSGLRIKPSWEADEPAVFVGYRTRVEEDGGLEDNIADRLTIYTSDIDDTYDAAHQTVLRAAIAPGSSWRHPTAGVTVRFRGVARKTGAAIVSVCRYGGPETPDTCRLRVDNDCNGLAGDQDPACGPQARDEL